MDFKKEKTNKTLLCLYFNFSKATVASMDPHANISISPLMISLGEEAATVALGIVSLQKHADRKVKVL